MRAFLLWLLLAGSAFAQGGIGPGPGTVHATASGTVSFSCPGTGSTSSTITCTGTYTGPDPSTSGWTYSWNSTCTGSGSVTSVASVSGGSITGIVVPTPTGACAGTVTITTNIPTSNSSGSVTISSPAVWTLIDKKACVSSSSSSGCTTAAVNSTGAKLIFITVGWFGNAPVISDNQSNSYSDLISFGSIGSTGAAMTSKYKISPTTGASHTFTAVPSASTSYIGFAVEVWGEAGTPTFDQGATNNSGCNDTTNSQQVGYSLTPGGNNALVLAYLANNTAAGGTVSIDSSFSLDVTIDSSFGNSLGAAMASRVFATPSATQPTYSTTSAPLNMCVQSISFLP